MTAPTPYGPAAPQPAFPKQAAYVPPWRRWLGRLTWIAIALIVVTMAVLAWRFLTTDFGQQANNAQRSSMLGWSAILMAGVVIVVAAAIVSRRWVALGFAIALLVASGLVVGATAWSADRYMTDEDSGPSCVCMSGGSCDCPGG
jgi:hypothetical protein